MEFSDPCVVVLISVDRQYMSAHCGFNTGEEPYLYDCKRATCSLLVNVEVLSQKSWSLRYDCDGVRTLEDALLLCRTDENVGNLSGTSEWCILDNAIALTKPTLNLRIYDSNKGREIFTRRWERVGFSTQISKLKPNKGIEMTTKTKLIDARSRYTDQDLSQQNADNQTMAFDLRLVQIKSAHANNTFTSCSYISPLVVTVPRLLEFWCGWSTSLCYNRCVHFALCSSKVSTNGGFSRT
ncbi:hypothetical protein L596_000650 [Steinernema carpocapsae]|uniref:Uncharacterized protein n=1 Tax=Steinernema carpocapsae TaxID=34508 RepID=A0A4U8UJJ8_STECR|nr:hypothetical protein L596_000650 [Steinernema carpocapsae]